MALNINEKIYYKVKKKIALNIIEKVYCKVKKINNRIITIVIYKSMMITDNYFNNFSLACKLNKKNMKLR